MFWPEWYCTLNCNGFLENFKLLKIECLRLILVTNWLQQTFFLPLDNLIIFLISLLIKRHNVTFWGHKERIFQSVLCIFSTTFFLCSCCLNKSRNWNNIVKVTKFSQLKCRNVTVSVTLWHSLLNLYSLFTKCIFPYLGVSLFILFLSICIYLNTYLVYSLWLIIKWKFFSEVSKTLHCDRNQ